VFNAASYHLSLLFVLESGLINDHANTTFSFKRGKTYRLRLINMSGIALFNVYIDGHDLEVIEVDGVKYLGY
jgi:iron transport multicopper oxidase